MIANVSENEGAPGTNGVNPLRKPKEQLGYPNLHDLPQLNPPSTLSAHGYASYASEKFASIREHPSRHPLLSFHALPLETLKKFISIYSPSYNSALLLS